jgi:hypothetical protein
VEPVVTVVVAVAVIPGTAGGTTAASTSIIPIISGFMLVTNTSLPLPA